MTNQPSPLAQLLSVDWGTTRLRVRLVQCEPFKTVAEAVTDDGVSATFAAWKASGESDREPFFLARIQSAVKQLESKLEAPTIGMPVVISGMASSSIGMRELPYARAPVFADAANLRSQFLPATDDFAHPTLLVSGVSTDADVMRGEETQLAGLLPHGGDGTYLLPGTHSKHIEVCDGRIVDFRTYVTGEMFALIAERSVLVDCVELGDDDAISPDFARGVKAASKTNLLHEVFSIRARALVGGRSDKVANADYLSGLLIGSELQDLNKVSANQIVLAAAAALRRRYQSALETLGRADQTIQLDEAVVEESASRGHVELYRRSAELLE